MENVHRFCGTAQGPVCCPRSHLKAALGYAETGRWFMQVRLRILSSEYAGKEVAVTSPKFVIGRSGDCQPVDTLASLRNDTIIAGDSTGSVTEGLHQPKGNPGEDMGSSCTPWATCPFVDWATTSATGSTNMGSKLG